jgi:hypothetical protein
MLSLQGTRAHWAFENRDNPTEQQGYGIEGERNIKSSRRKEETGVIAWIGHTIISTHKDVARIGWNRY